MQLTKTEQPTGLTSIDAERFETIKNIILQSRLLCDREAPAQLELRGLIVTWNQALGRIPTEKLMLAWKSFIEHHEGQPRWITAFDVLAGYRIISQRETVPVYRRIEAPKITPPEEYYEELAKHGFYPRETVLKKSTPIYAPTKNYSILNDRQPCSSCKTMSQPVIYFKQEFFCLACGRLIPEIIGIHSNLHDTQGEQHGQTTNQESAGNRAPHRDQ